MHRPLYEVGLPFFLVNQDQSGILPLVGGISNVPTSFFKMRSDRGARTILNKP